MALGGRPERDERRILFSISQASPIKDFSSDLTKGCSFEPDRRPAFSYYCPQFHRPGVDRTVWTRVAILLARISFACRDRQKDFGWKLRREFRGCICSWPNCASIRFTGRRGKRDWKSLTATRHRFTRPDILRAPMETSPRFRRLS